MDSIYNLIIELTRKCNMSCSHCLRGEQQNKTIQYKHIDCLLTQLERGYISNVTFTGGEPSLNVPAINYFLEKCKQLSVSIGSFYIATNGLEISENFVITCLKLYAYCDEKEMCSVVVSNDIFHANENSYNTILLDGLSFFSRKHEKESNDYNEYSYLLNEGRAKDNYNCGRLPTVQKISSKEDFNDCNIYLNCDGYIINGCDWSYANQSKHKLCNVNELSKYYQTLED